MKSKKRPLNFAAPTFAEDAPPPVVSEDTLALGMPPVRRPAPEDKPVAQKSEGLSSPTLAADASRQEERRRLPLFHLAIAAISVGRGLTASTLGFRSHVGPFEDESLSLHPDPGCLLGLAPVRADLDRRLRPAPGRQTSGRGQPTAEHVGSDDRAHSLAASRGGRVGQRHPSGNPGGDRRAVDKAQQELAHLHNPLSRESDRLIEMASGSARDAMGLVQSLGRERQEFGVLSTKLEGRVGEIGDAIGRHARMVSEASDLAQTQIQEAEAGPGRPRRRSGGRGRRSHGIRAAGRRGSRASRPRGWNRPA